MSRPLDRLLRDIRACRICEAHLPLGPNPVLRASATATLLVVGQAPGTKVHATDRAGGRSAGSNSTEPMPNSNSSASLA